MKIMETSSEDGECQVEAVMPRSKKSKKERLPFKNLTSDSPIANKKRKSAISPDAKKAKQPKVNTKENSSKTKKTDVQEITIDEENLEEDKQEKEVGKISNVKDHLKRPSITPDSKNKKLSTGKGSAKGKKSESKVQSNSLTKFFKKIDDKNKILKNETQIVSKNEEPEKKGIVVIDLDESDEKTEKSEKKDSLNNEQKEKMDKNVHEKSKEVSLDESQDDLKSEKRINEDSDEELQMLSSSDEDENQEAEKSTVTQIEKMDVDSDTSVSNDGSSSGTDSKKTEHEDTDSRDDTRKYTKQMTTPTRDKLLDSTSKTKKLTPKQLEKKLENQKKRENREKQRMEREKKMQEERENRKKEKEEKKREREEKEKALKEQRRKEKEEKELKKQAELEQKQKEKEAKEEDRRKREEAKEEEKRKKEEERLEAERKKKKAASTFVSFFVPKKPTETKQVEEETKVETKNFMPFEVKADMRVAPITRRNLTKDEKLKLEELVKSNDTEKSELYIDEIKSKKYDVRKSGKTWPYEANDDIVILEDEEEDSSNVVQASNVQAERHRAKLLLFSENRRPPYWGTWRKKSTSINARRPFATDTKWFDYEVDSDDEWEEEEPGESLRGSDDEKEEDPDDNEYDVDNDFMVPHGYLSEEEIMADEEEEEDENEDESNPEKKNTKLKIMNEQFEAERKQKTTKLHPKVIGCIWLKEDNTYPENTPSSAVRILTARQAWVREIPLSLTAPAEGDLAESSTFTIKQAALSARKAQALEEAMPDLIRLLHGNNHGRGFLVKEFLEFWNKKKEGKAPLPKSKLDGKIRDIASWIACPEPGPMQDKSCWWVAEEYRTKYLPGETLSLPNRWTYTLTPKRKSTILEVPEKSEDKEKEPEKKNIPLITQFTKTLTAEEMQKQLAEKVSSPVASKAGEKQSTPKSITPVATRPPKRASLISVPRGEPFVKVPRVSLIDMFVAKDTANAGDDKKKNDKSQSDLDNNDCVLIDDDDKVNVIADSTETDGKKNAPAVQAESKNNKNDTTQDAKTSASTETENTSKSSGTEVMEIN